MCLKVLLSLSLFFSSHNQQPAASVSSFPITSVSQMHPFSLRPSTEQAHMHSQSHSVLSIRFSPVHPFHSMFCIAIAGHRNGNKVPHYHKHNCKHTEDNSATVLLTHRRYVSAIPSSFHRTARLPPHHPASTTSSRSILYQASTITPSSASPTNASLDPLGLDYDAGRRTKAVHPATYYPALLITFVELAGCSMLTLCLPQQQEHSVPVLGRFFFFSLRWHFRWRY